MSESAGEGEGEYVNQNSGGGRHGDWPFVQFYGRFSFRGRRPGRGTGRGSDGLPLSTGPLASTKLPLLHLAAEAGDAVRVAALLAEGYPADEPDHLGMNPLHYAVGRPPVVRLLLDAGADPSRWCSSGEGPLKLAAVEGNAESVRLLLERGADPDSAEGVEGATPLLCAVEAGFVDVAAALVEHGADPFLRESCNRGEWVFGFLAQMLRDGGQDAETARRIAALLRLHPREWMRPRIEKRLTEAGL